MDISRLLRDEEIVLRKKVILSAGEDSNFYVDVKKAYGNPRVLSAMANAMNEVMSGKTTCIATRGYGGIPLATALSLIRDVPLTIIRDKPKGYGLGNLIEGYIPNDNDRVAIVDDVLTTGKNLLEIAKIIEDTGVKIDEAHVVVIRNKVNLPFKINYLVEAKDLL